MTQARPDRRGESGALFLLIGFGLFFFADSVADPDLWGHVRFGQDVLRAGAVVRADPYSYRTGGRDWINHEWLAEVLFAGLYEGAGPTGLIALKTSTGVLILTASYLRMRFMGVGALGAVVLLAVVCVPLRMGLGTIRPQLFTYALFPLLLMLIERATPGREARLWPVPVVLAAWTNLHGGVLAGLGVLILWGVVRVVRLCSGGGRPTPRDWSGVVRVVGIVIAGCSGLLVNPYGVALPLFLLRTAVVPRHEILEWMPLGLSSLPGLAYLALVAVGVLGLVGSRRPREPEALMILGVTAILPMISGRHFPLFALSLLVLAAEHVADAWERWRLPRLDPTRRRVWVGAVQIVAGMSFAVLALPRFACIRLDPFAFSFPARAVAVLKRSEVGGNLAVPFVWGEYVLWHLGPGVKVSIDGRRETVYSDRSYRQSLDFERGTGDWEAMLKPPTDMVLSPSTAPTTGLMDRTAGWRLVYGDGLSRLYVREGSPLAQPIVNQPTPALPDDGRGLCFPDPSRRGRR